MKFIYQVITNLFICLVLALIRIQTSSIVTDGQDAPISDIMSNKNVACFSPNMQCSDLKSECLKCDFNYSCIYGSYINTTCRPIIDSDCIGDKEFTKTHLCSFCYQLPSDLYNCTTTTPCSFHTRYKAMCTVNDDVICFGNRKFNKFVKCEFISGYKWSSALLLSITLGGFGVDRFYLGNWQEGIGKLFSFGGLGIWTLIDVILIATGYLKPSDGSIYV